MVQTRMSIEYGEPVERKVHVDKYYLVHGTPSGLAIEKITAIGDADISISLAGNELERLTVKQPEYLFPFPIPDVVVAFQQFHLYGTGDVIITERSVAPTTRNFLDLTAKYYAFPIYVKDRKQWLVTHEGVSGFFENAEFPEPPRPYETYDELKRAMRPLPRETQ